ncbi:hypothetical protein BXU08_15105 [Sphingomonas sp. LM7]|nr:hypothetical protein BXU08_15105 [Sphingomonas sp. LM7]
MFVLLAAFCLPPPPGMPEPTPPSEAEKARVIATTFSNIVSGVVTRNDNKVRFKILKVYKGTLKRGQVIDAYPAHGFYSDQPCPGMIPPLPTIKGATGVIAFNELPAPLQWVESRWLAEMKRTGLVQDPR